MGAVLGEIPAAKRGYDGFLGAGVAGRGRAVFHVERGAWNGGVVERGARNWEAGAWVRW